MDYSPWGHKESDTTEQQHRQMQVVRLNYAQHVFVRWNKRGSQTSCLWLGFRVFFQ